MNTVIKIKNLLVNFFVDHFWSIIIGACLTTGIAAVFIFADNMGNYDTFVETATIKNMAYNLINAFHTGVTTYWDVMGTVDIIIFFTTIGIILIRAFYDSTVQKYN